MNACLLAPEIGMALLALAFFLVILLWWKFSS